MNLNTGITVLRLALGFVVWIAIGLQFSIHLGLGFSVVNFFSYFTNLSNLFAATVLIVSAVPAASRRKLVDPVRAVSVVNMVVVGIVFTVLLRNADLGSLRPWINILLHYVMPCAVVLDWLIQPPQRSIAMRRLPLFLVFPAVYLAYVLIRGRQVNWYPYPFLNPANVGGYGVVTLHAAGIALTFLAAGWAVSKINDRAPSAGSSAP